MKGAALLMLLVPLGAMVAGFLAALRALLRGGAGPIDGYTPSGRPALRSEPKAFLRSFLDAPAVPGRGTLLLTDRDLVFERFFPRREVAVDLARIVAARVGGEGRRGGILLVEWGPCERFRARGFVLEVPDAEGWAEAIRRAGASPRRTVGAPAPDPAPPAP
jgi:hypothetical protein